MAIEVSTAQISKIMMALVRAEIADNDKVWALLENRAALEELRKGIETALRKEWNFSHEGRGRWVRGDGAKVCRYALHIWYVYPPIGKEIAQVENAMEGMRLLDENVSPARV